MKLKLTISYNGSGYCGWQAQKNGRSVQETLTRAVSELYGVRCLVTGASRTDSGVHAKNYVCTVEGADGVDVSEKIPIRSLPNALNAHLPEEIAVKNAEVVPDEFHARYSVRSKTYEYVFFDSAVRSPFLSGRAFQTLPISDAALENMKKAAEKMCGKHDFKAFMAAGSKITDTVRTVYSSSVERHGETVVFTVSADGFLYNMVRIMAGTLLAAARGKITPDDVGAIIESGDRRSAGTTLPPYGLYLMNVEY